MEDYRQQMLEELSTLGVLLNENPCGMKKGVMSALSEVLHSFIGKACIEDASKDQVAIYLNRDVRTITRWQQQYSDFPHPRHNGHHEVSYNWMEIVKWKLNHKELFSK